MPPRTVPSASDFNIGPPELRGVYLRRGFGSRVA
jgi:hypothetical protein